MNYIPSMYDFLIVGAGIIGLTLAWNIKKEKPNSKVLIIEKEEDVGFHASSRNSGVLHAGFYYFPDTLKAKFTKEGNEEMTRYCETKGLKINKCGKVVVAKSEKDLEILYGLKHRGDRNGVEVYLIDEKDLREIEPNAKTFKHALWSPKTSTVDPKEVVLSIKKDLIDMDVEFLFSTPYKKKLDDNTIIAGNRKLEYGKLINSAGLYADKIAKDFGLCKKYIIVPFKGVYFEYKEKFLRRNVYPVPNRKNPFLGVHFTVSVDGSVKIGPTAFPCFWRENYKGFENFKAGEFFETVFQEFRIFLKNKNFRDTAFEEIRKYLKIFREAEKLVANFDRSKVGQMINPGIRAQLVDIESGEFIYDFVVEENRTSIHILNAVSPAFTASFPFTRFIVKKYIFRNQIAPV